MKQQAINSHKTTGGNEWEFGRTRDVLTFAGTTNVSKVNLLRHATIIADPEQTGTSCFTGSNGGYIRSFQTGLKYCTDAQAQSVHSLQRQEHRQPVRYKNNAFYPNKTMQLPYTLVMNPLIAWQTQCDTRLAEHQRLQMSRRPTDPPDTSGTPQYNHSGI